MSAPDLVVVGGGTAGLTAALAARERGAAVLLLEKSEARERGGNGRLTGGNVRFAFAEASELAAFVPQLDAAAWARADITPYPAASFAQDLMTASCGRADPALSRWLADESFGAAQWLCAHGARWQLSDTFGTTSDGIGLTIAGGGPALVETLYQAAGGAGIEVWYGCAVHELLIDEEGRIRGVRARRHGADLTVPARAGVVLAAGGFEADAALRARYLGPRWGDVVVRSVAHDTGEVLMDALRIGAAAHGAWDECHACPVDARSPRFGDETTGERTIRLAFPFGITVNVDGRRFMDEGLDVAARTYAAVGRHILAQPQGRAFQIFDQQTVGLLDARYRDAQPIVADSIEQLARQAGIEAGALATTVAQFNAAVAGGTPFDPARLDGCRAAADPPKSHWATRLERPPFLAYEVVAGITFTYGGLRIDTASRVLRADGSPIAGLFAAGEITGGFFFDPYPAACGIIRNVVTGIGAGREAAHRAPA